MQKNQSSLAGFLREKRIACKLTQNEVAKTLGYTTPQFVSNWERGISSPPVMIIKRLSELYSVEPDEMFKILLADAIGQVESALRQQFYSARKNRKVSN